MVAATPSTTGATTYGDTPCSCAGNATSATVAPVNQSVACENRRQNARTGRDIAIMDPIRWQATVAAASDTGPPRYAGLAESPLRHSSHAATASKLSNPTTSGSTALRARGGAVVDVLIRPALPSVDPVVT
jgi:hypothetical protein